MRGVVQVVKKNGGENNLHYHTGIASFWMVLKGRVRFYGPGDVVIGEFGPHEGTITPRFSRYWFENVGEDDLEILQVAAFGSESSRRAAAPTCRRIASIPIPRSISKPTPRLPRRDADGVAPGVEAVG